MKIALKTVLALATLVLLSSIGGAMGIAAPVVLPLLWLATRDSHGPTAFLWIFLAIATTGEAAWIYTYLALGERDILIWVLPVLAMVATATIFAVAALGTGRKPLA